MRWSALAAMVLLACWTPGGKAHAGIYSDELAKCLVKSTTSEDRKALAVWIYSAMSRHPYIKSYSKLSASESEAATKTASELMQRLMIVDCRNDTGSAIKFEGTSALERAFTVLGEVASREIMSAPEVAKGIEQLGEFVDVEKFNELAKEYGLRDSTRR